MAHSTNATAIVDLINKSIAVKQRIVADPAFLSSVEATIDRCTEALRRGNKILVAGNGGSAADAQHLAGELVCRFGFDRPSLASIALTTDSSVLTAIGNDYGYEQIFARQIAGLGRAGDVFIAISTSGSSPNILAALKEARQRQIFVVGFSGLTGGAMKDLCDICLCVPSTETPRIQEGHELISHIVCARIEMLMFGDGKQQSAP